jgi:hypothetical protein
MSKYRKLVQLLKDCGVMQLDQPWAQEIQALVKKHKRAKPICRQPQAHPDRCGYKE